jgi:hypothetical protein
VKVEGEAAPASVRWARRAAVWRMRPGAHLATLAGLGLLALLLAVAGPPRYAARLAPGMGAPPARPALPVAIAPPATETPIPALTAVAGTTPAITATAVYSTAALLATAEALASVLPTASPDLGLPDNKAVGFQRNDLWNRAIRTAIALYPPPLGYHPPDLFTPVAHLTPLPTEPVRPAGAGSLYEDGWGGDYSKLMVIANQWWETVDAHNLFVYAGRNARTDPLQGQLLVAVYDSATLALVRGPDFYLTPSRHGLVRIIDAVGERLTLRTVDGTLFYFDVPRRQWVAPPPGPSPTP